MPYTVHETILQFMTLSENTGQVGYPLLRDAADLSWYKLFKKTNESIVRKWMPVTCTEKEATVAYPCSLEKLLGVYVVDHCGDLAPLLKDDIKNIIPRLTSTGCTCTECDKADCMCPSVQDAIVQTDVVISGNTYTNKVFSRLLKTGEVVEETHTWVKNSSGGVEEVVQQTTKCVLETLPCGCPVDCEANAQALVGCGCLVECAIPAIRDRYPNLYNDFGYYKENEGDRKLHLFNREGKKSLLTQVMVVFQSNGADMLVPDYARHALFGLLDWSRKMYSPSYDWNDRREAKKNYNREETEMIRYLNPIPFEWFVNVGDATKNSETLQHGRRSHSDFVHGAPSAPATTPVAPTIQYITNNIYQSGGSSSAGSWLKVVVDGGGPDDPVSGINTYQNDALIGLGGPQARLTIKVDAFDMQSWGAAKSFDYDPAIGKITMLSGFIFLPGSALEIDLNQ